MSVSTTTPEVEQAAAEKPARATMNSEDRAMVREFAAKNKVTRFQAFQALEMPGVNPYSESGQHPNTRTGQRKVAKKTSAKKSPKRTAVQRRISPREEAMTKAAQQSAMIGRLAELDGERQQIMSTLAEMLAGERVSVEPGQVLQIEAAGSPVTVTVPEEAHYRVLSHQR